MSHKLILLFQTLILMLLEVKSKAMRFDKAFGNSSYFGKVYRESRKSNISVHFRQSVERRKSTVERRRSKFPV